MVKTSAAGAKIRQIDQYYQGVTNKPQVLKSSPKREYKEVTTLDCVGNVVIPTFFFKKGLDGGKSQKKVMSTSGNFLK
jgi:hypothetical protein